MISYTIANKNIEKARLLQYYQKAKEVFPDFNFGDLDKIFNVALDNLDRFPSINIQDEESPELYIDRWVKNYHDATILPPSKRSAKPKTACTDPAIKTIVKTIKNLEDDEGINEEHIHALFMSAENVQGNLLEEYISMKAHKYGFLWCNGDILRAIDFCNSDGSLLLQIKNKSNTENSSSSNIREGTAIEKWYRLGTKTHNGKKLPKYNWEKLNQIINEYKTEGLDLDPCSMSEPEYQEFLVAVASENQNLISDE